VNPADIPADLVVDEDYGDGWIKQSWLWACDQCLNRALAEDDVDGVNESSGTPDTLQEARLELMTHNASERHARR
jgi:hypothetical protein